MVFTRFDNEFVRSSLRPGRMFMAAIATRHICRIFTALQNASYKSTTNYVGVLLDEDQREQNAMTVIASFRGELIQY
jgi:hypothetical protein